MAVKCWGTMLSIKYIYTAGGSRSPATPPDTRPAGHLADKLPSWYTHVHAHMHRRVGPGPDHLFVSRVFILWCRAADLDMHDSHSENELPTRASSPSIRSTPVPKLSLNLLDSVAAHESTANGHGRGASGGTHRGRSLGGAVVPAAHGGGGEEADAASRKRVREGAARSVGTRLVDGDSIVYGGRVMNRREDGGGAAKEVGTGNGGRHMKNFSEDIVGAIIDVHREQKSYQTPNHNGSADAGNEASQGWNINSSLRTGVYTDGGALEMRAATNGPYQTSHHPYQDKDKDAHFSAPSIRS